MSKVLSIISGIMITFAFLFFVYAINHPTLLIIVPIIGVKGLYLIYFIVVIALVVISRLLKRKS